MDWFSQEMKGLGKRDFYALRDNFDFPSRGKIHLASRFFLPQGMFGALRQIRKEGFGVERPQCPAIPEKGTPSQKFKEYGCEGQKVPQSPKPRKNQSSEKVTKK